MDAILTETVERDGQVFRISIYPDGDTHNPLQDWGEMGSILSLNARHHNFDPGRVEAALAGNADAVPLSYFEHGLCHWSVAGELPPGCRCPFDAVDLAGVWLPDAETLASARPYGGFTRRMFMRRRARQACDAYSQWCNGEVYGFEVSRIGVCPCCGDEKAEPVDACWGFYGLEACRAEARAAVAEATPAGISPTAAASAPPSRFEIEHDPQAQPDRVHVRVDDRFDVAVVRTPEGIVIDVYPKDWDAPIDTMTVWDDQVSAVLDESDLGG